MIKYGTLDYFGNKIRNEKEIEAIKKDLDQYLLTGNDDFILQYLKHYENLREVLKEGEWSTKSYAIMLWDIKHPLEGEDLKRWQKIMRKKIIDAKIFS